MTAVITESGIEARVRAEVYAFASKAVQYPREPVTLDLLDYVRFDDEQLDSCRADIIEASATDVPSMQAAHRTLFPAVESQDAPSYETAYSKRDVFHQGQVMADVAGFYGAHGLSMGGPKKDRPDAIGPELEFVGFLAAKQAHAATIGRSDMAELCLDTQKAFLRDHLGTWGPGYGRRMAAVSDHAFYSALGQFLSVWLETDMLLLDVVPLTVDDVEDGNDGDAVLLADPRLGWDDLSCGGVV